MLLTTTLRFATLLAALLLTLPALAASHEPATAKSAKPRQTVAGRSLAAKEPTGTLAVVTPPMAASEAPTTPLTVLLTGVVLLADGQPCPGASVYVSNAPRQVVITDAHGAFALPVPAGAPVALKADYFGVGSTRVALDKPNTQPLRLTLGR